MHENPHLFRARLQKMNLKIRHAAELAEAQVEPVNQLIFQLAKTGLVNNSILLVNSIARRTYDANHSQASGQVIQAALAVQKGIGVVYWDSEELAYLQHSPNLESEALLRHVPFEECDTAMKALLLPELVSLLDACLAAFGEL